jgi:hypothetical protein
MLKAIPAILFTTLGASAAGVAVYVQTEPRAFTSSKPALLESASDRMARRAKTMMERIEPVPPAAKPEDDVVRGELVIYARPHVIAAAKRKTDTALRPCSEWRELDPQSKVRMLCQPDQ